MTPPLDFQFYLCLGLLRLTRMLLITSVSNTPLWSQSEPHICLSLLKKKDCTNPEMRIKKASLNITLEHQNYVQIFTDGSKVDKKVAAEAVPSVASNSPFSGRQRDQCSVYTV